MTEHQSRPGEAKRWCPVCEGRGTIPDMCPDGKIGCAVYHSRVCPRCKGSLGAYVLYTDHAAWVAYATKLEAEIAALKRG